MPLTNDEFCQGQRARKLERNPYSPEAHWGQHWAWEQGYTQSQGHTPHRGRKPKPKTDLEELMEIAAIPNDNMWKDGM